MQSLFIMSARINCPCSGSNLAVSSLQRHMGSRICLETKNPRLRAERLEEARQNKLRYDAIYTRERRQAMAAVGTTQTATQHVELPSPPTQATNVAVDMCPVCFDTDFVPVRPVSCRHVLCTGCMSHLFASWISDHDSGSPPCPVCRKALLLSSN